MDLDEYINGTLDECANTKKKLNEGYDIPDITVDEIRKALDSGELVLDSLLGDDADVEYVVIKPASNSRGYEVF
jgi:hypothetical protein